MMFSTRLSTAVLMLFASVAAAAGPKRPEKLMKEDVKIQSDRFFIAVNRLDAAQLTDFFTADAVLQLPDDPRVQGRANVIASIDNAFNSVTSFKPTTKSLVRSGATFVQTSTFELTVRQDDGSEDMASGSLRIVWRLTAARPLIASLSLTFDPELSRADQQLVADVLVQSERFITVYNRLDAAQLGRFYAADATVVGQPRITGRAAIVKALAMQQKTVLKVEGETTSVHKVGDKTFEERGTYVATERKDGRIVKQSGTYRFVWKFFGPIPVIIEQEAN